MLADAAAIRAILETLEDEAVDRSEIIEIEAAKGTGIQVLSFLGVPSARDIDTVVSAPGRSSQIIKPKIASKTPTTYSDNAETALIEISPNEYLAFGELPHTVSLEPTPLFDRTHLDKIGAHLNDKTGLLNLGGQIGIGVTNGIMRAQGVVRLAPESIALLRQGAVLGKSGGQMIGNIINPANGKIVALARLAPLGAAGGLVAALPAVAAAVGPAIAIIAIQRQLGRIEKLAAENLSLTQSVLDIIHDEQWAELAGLSTTIQKTMREAAAVGRVTPRIWEQVAHLQSSLRKQRDLYRRNIDRHIDKMSAAGSVEERKEYLSHHGNSLILDAAALIEAERAWFTFNALRIGELLPLAIDHEEDARLIHKIQREAAADFEQSRARVADILSDVRQELTVPIDTYPGFTFPWSGKRRTAKEVRIYADRLIASLNEISPDSVVAGSTASAHLLEGAT